MPPNGLKQERPGRTMPSVLNGLYLLYTSQNLLGTIFRVTFTVFYRRIWNIVGKYSILCCDSGSARMPTRAPVGPIPPRMWPLRRATMLEWQGIEFRILKPKLHSCSTYRVVCAGVGGRHGYRLSYASQGIGPNGRGRSSLGPSWELRRHHCRKSP
jgi:hypothetical protein